MSARFSRRSFIAGISAAGTAMLLGRSTHAAPQARIHETKVISHQNHRYHGWPTLARRAGGELLLVCSGGRESHVCPFGRVELMRSKDNGRSWSWPEVVMDGPIDDRDAGVAETVKGTILVTTFTSLAYEPILWRAEREGNWSGTKLQRWQAAHGRVDAAGRKKALGVWMKRSSI